MVVLVLLQVWLKSILNGQFNTKSKYRPIPLLSTMFWNTIYSFLYQVICTQRINPDGTRVILGSMYMGYDIYPTLQVNSHPPAVGGSESIGWSPNRGSEAPEIWRRSPNRGRSTRKSGGGVCGGGSVSPSPENLWNFELQIVQSGV